MNPFYKLMIISLFTLIMFGFIDALFFGIYLNEGGANFFEKIGLNSDDSDIMVGALSASTAVIATTYMKKYSKKLFGEIIEHPLLDVSGIIIGTYLYIVLARKYNNFSIKYIKKSS